MKSGILFGCNPTFYIYVKLNIYIYTFQYFFRHVDLVYAWYALANGYIPCFQRLSGAFCGDVSKLVDQRAKSKSMNTVTCNTVENLVLFQGPKECLVDKPNVEAEVSMGVTMDSHCDDSRPCKAIEPGPRR